MKRFIFPVVVVLALLSVAQVVVNVPYDNNPLHYLNGQGRFTTPAGGGSGGQTYSFDLSHFTVTAETNVALSRAEINLGTIANGGTATLVLSINVSRATYSGATATIVLPTITITTNSYLLTHFGTNTSGGSQVLSFQSLLRNEMGGSTLVTTITNNTGAGFDIMFASVGGVWSRVYASGDALTFPGSASANWASSGSTNSALPGNALANSGTFTNGLSLGNSNITSWAQITGTGIPGGAALSIQYNSNGVFNGFGSYSNSTSTALIPNAIIQTNLFVLGNTNGFVRLYDGDGDKFIEIAAAPVIVTNIVVTFPTTPNVGALVGASLTLATNVQAEFVGAPLNVYAAGTAYALTATSAALDFGTTDPSLVISHAGTYLLMGRTIVRYNGATFAANQTLTLKLRRTNNTAADIANSSSAYTTEIVTTKTANFIQAGFAPVIYTTANLDDAITIFGDISVVPSAGSLDATAASILAIRLY